MRAVYLERGLKELLHDDDLVASLYNHAIINGLYEGSYAEAKKGKSIRFAKLRSLLPSGSNLPSYIPARTFALAIMDLLASSTGTTPRPVTTGAVQSAEAERTTVDTQGVTMRETEPQSSPPSSPLSSPLSSPPDGPKSGVVLTPSDDLLINQARHAVILLANAAGNDAEQARKNIEDWYNNAMDRVSGWYKRRTQRFLFGVGLVLAIVLNVELDSRGDRALDRQAEAGRDRRHRHGVSEGEPEASRPALDRHQPADGDLHAARADLDSTSRRSSGRRS